MALAGNCRVCFFGQGSHQEVAGSNFVAEWLECHPTKMCKPRQLGTSHSIFKTPWVGDPRINIQDDKGKAKKCCRLSKNWRDLNER